MEVRVERSGSVEAFNHTNQERQVLNVEDGAVRKVGAVVTVCPENHREGFQKLAVHVKSRPPNEPQLQRSEMRDPICFGEVVECVSDRGTSVV